MATKFHEKVHYGTDLSNIMIDAHSHARELKPGQTGKISTKVEDIGTTENTTGGMVMKVRISYFIDA